MSIYTGPKPLTEEEKFELEALDRSKLGPSKARVAANLRKNIEALRAKAI
jgi:hypothetical protein